jgi:hypothetical protein
MIRGYSDHAANERTFLAWVRTGIAVIAFGFVIEKFNLFVLTMANANSLDARRRLQLERQSRRRPQYDERARSQARVFSFKPEETSWLASLLRALQF